MIKYHIFYENTYGILGKEDLTIKPKEKLLTSIDDEEDLWHRSPDYLFLCKWETNIKTLEKMIKDARANYYTNIKTFVNLIASIGFYKKNYRSVRLQFQNFLLSMLNKLREKSHNLKKPYCLSLATPKLLIVHFNL